MPYVGSSIQSGTPNDDGATGGTSGAPSRERSISDSFGYYEATSGLQMVLKELEASSECGETGSPIIRRMDSANEDIGPVEHLDGDPYTVDADLCDGPGPGDIEALATPPCEFCSTLSSNFQPGQAFIVQGPFGPVRVVPPEGAKPGMSLRFRLAPKPDFRIQVPEGAKPGDQVKFERDDGVQVSVAVPPNYSPGSFFEVLPPALMVKVPAGITAGCMLYFRGAPRAQKKNSQGGSADIPTELWYRARVPVGLEAGRYLSARLPMSRGAQPRGPGWWNAPVQDLRELALTQVRSALRLGLAKFA
mmetsp:Transcript_30603/g.60044  ORF Transcript_30603/g.60044 Transcript_30603/m.60044 type:complete len:304 (+) Transcript_30603:44-955(+)